MYAQPVDNARDATVSTVALSDRQAALVYSLVRMALVQKTESPADRPGEPRYRDVLDRWLEATADDLEEVRARLAEGWASRLEEQFTEAERFSGPC